MSCTINPILYNLLSRKFRQAFKRTLCRCCLGFDVNSIPVLYRLKAKFVNGGGAPSGAGLAARGDGGDDVGNALLGVRGPAHRLYTKPACFRWAAERGVDIYLAQVVPAGDADGGGNHFNTHGCRASSRRYKLNAQPSTKETTCAGRDSSSSSAHAHSDGRLHRICRHKYCPTARAAFGAGLTPPSVRTQSTSSGMRQQQLMTPPVSALTPTRHYSGDKSPKSIAVNAHGMFDTVDAITPFNNNKNNNNNNNRCRTVRLIQSHANVTHCLKTNTRNAKQNCSKTKCRTSAAFSY